MLNKKYFLTLLLQIIIAASLLGCNAIKGEPSDASLAAASAESTAEPTAAPMPTATPEPTPFPKPTVYHYDLDIPVYTEITFFRHFPICFDQCAYDGSNIGYIPHSIDDILAELPTDALRTRSNGSKYAIYETDTGYRFYLIFQSLFNNGDPKYLYGRGFPVMIKEVNSFADFAALKAGDPLDLVIQIDPVAHYIEDYYKGKPQFRDTIHNDAEAGAPISSLHYLTDGILQIAYDMTENGELFVYDMIYSEDYKLTSHTGIIVDYKLFDVDLPRQ